MNNLLNFIFSTFCRKSQVNYIRLPHTFPVSKSAELGGTLILNTDNFSMGNYFQILLLVITATVLIWFGYTLFSGMMVPVSVYRMGKKRRFPKPRDESYPGAPRTCPVCSAKLGEGELVKTLAFPSLNGGKDRMMHIKGCLFCLCGERERLCPVCGHALEEDEILICRLFERPYTFRKRPHVHVLGCSQCRGI